MTDGIRARFQAALPAGLDHVSLRWVEERTEELSVVRGIIQPPRMGVDVGAMLTVHHGQGVGYAATADLSTSGLARAIERAAHFARLAEQAPVAGLAGSGQRPQSSGEWSPDLHDPWSALPLPDRLDLLKRACDALKLHDDIVHWAAQLTEVQWRSHWITSDGVEVYQAAPMLQPELTAVAHRTGLTQRRTMGAGRGRSQQADQHTVASWNLPAEASRVASEAVQLLDAPVCPSGPMTLLLAPDQMMLQIHESIGHPLELDRILGDERNYAGTSFVTPDMFGTYMYGSEHLTVTFDPTVHGELASYGWDDDGTPATRTTLIDAGRLICPLGGQTSQSRAGLPGVANSRACSWNRPAIDRMANLNLEPGTSSVEELIAEVEDGVLMVSNLSWSIDDRRDKFQFGCEMAHRIKDGELGEILRNPNYRGRSATFWRNLSGVANRDSMEVLGTPFCGKGEPNQVIRVGHASPTCRFDNVDVFGGEA